MNSTGKKLKKNAKSEQPIESDILSSFRESMESLENKEVDNKHFWNNFIRAMDAEPRDHTYIKGASGVEHKLLGLGVNDKDNRLVLVSDTPSAEYAAMMQVDVSAGTDLKVVIARPAAFDLAGLASKITAATGSNFLTDEFITALGAADKLDTEAKRIAIQEMAVQVFGTVYREGLQAFKFTPLSLYSQILQITSQLSLIRNAKLEDQDALFSFDLGTLAKHDVTCRDRELGICPVPLFEFTEHQMEMLLSGSSLDDIKNELAQLEIYQYFFPDAYDLGLALVDRGITEHKKVNFALSRAPSLGHPFNGPDSDLSTSALASVLIELTEAGKLTETEFEHYQITPDGIEKRTRFSTRPSEGFVFKLLKAIFGKDFHFHL